jgi:hypothetical protein
MGSEARVGEVVDRSCALVKPALSPAMALDPRSSRGCGSATLAPHARLKGLVPRNTRPGAGAVGLACKERTMMCSVRFLARCLVLNLHTGRWRSWLQVASCIVACALVLYGVFLGLAAAQAVAIAAPDQTPLAFELCVHDGGTPFFPEGAPRDHGNTQFQCLFCVAGGQPFAAVLLLSLVPIFVQAAGAGVWRLAAWHLLDSPRYLRAHPRGPPFTA